jgi:geranylgeranylglycerol-phosphate geranylgeranyltransferase
MGLTLAAAMAVGAAGNALNDVYDVEIDRVNRPDRPLPSGTLTPRSAWLVAAVCLLAGLRAAFLASFQHFLFAVAVSGSLWLYSVLLKRLPLVGNLAVAAVVASTPIFGSLPWAPGAAVWSAAGFAFLTILAREIVKDMEDVPGDALHAARTLPLVTGSRFTRLAAATVTLVTIGLTPLPYLKFGFSGAYLGLVLVADVFLLAAFWRITRNASEALSLQKASRWLKAAMAAGLAALALASPSGFAAIG